MEVHSSSRRSSVTSQRGNEGKVDIETLSKKMEDQQKQLEEEIKQLREELKKKDAEAKSTENIAPSEKKGPYIERITDENCSRLSPLYPGMLMNEDGSLTRTPMSETWSKHTTYQLEKRHESRPQKEEALESLPDHPEPTTYDCVWSHNGEWVDVPTEPNGTGNDKTNTTVGRIEKIITREGNIKEVVGYGTNDDTLKIWYSLEDMKKAFPNWVRPNPSKYYNSRVFSNSIRREQGRDRSGAPPGDQSNRDIQGGRGRGRGRGGTGYSRGSFQSQNRGRGRGYHQEEYNQWDATQSSGPGRGGPVQAQAERTWWETNYSGDSYNASQERSQNRDPQEKDTPSYYTKDFDEKKRARSPSPREDRYRRDRSHERYESRRNYHDEGRDSNRSHGASTSRREYSPARRDHDYDRYERRDQSPRYRPESRPRYSRENSPNGGRRYSGHNR